MLLEEVQQHIKQAGLEAIADLKGENIHIDFVENMLAVHKKYRDLIQVKKEKKCFHTVLRICMFLGLLDPDPDLFYPNITKQNSKKNIDSYCFVTSKSNKKKNVF